MNIYAYFCISFTSLYILFLFVNYINVYRAVLKVAFYDFEQEGIEVGKIETVLSNMFKIFSMDAALVSMLFGSFFTFIVLNDVINQYLEENIGGN